MHRARAGFIQFRISFIREVVGYMYDWLIKRCMCLALHLTHGVIHSENRVGRSCLLLLAGGGVESVSDGLAGVAETFLG